MNKIKILFYNRDKAGVNYFRTQTPATQLERDHSDSFDIEITSQLDFSKEETLEYLKGFDIIHYHRSLVSGIENIRTIYPQLKVAGVKLIADVDDYWYLDKTHPYYSISLEQKMHEEFIYSLKLSDYVTTTTDMFADEIKKLTKEDNVVVLRNSVDSTWMTQFKDEWKPSDDGLVRINYIAGSSHGEDIQLLDGVVNRLQADPQTKNKFKIIVTGWDDEGSTKDVTFNEEFSKELQSRGLWDRNMVKQINRSRGDVDFINGLPDDLIHKYRNNIFFSKDRKINSDESIYFHYEKILTDNHKIINDKEYVNWLMKFERGRYNNETNFARIWTEKANVYAKALNETDISIAPLLDHKFNNMKSNLKQVECWTRKIPIVCSDVVPYNVDGVHERNCLLVPNNKKSDKLWYKALKKLIISEDYRKEIGHNLYDDFKEKFNLKVVTDRRSDFYKEILNTK